MNTERQCESLFPALYDLGHEMRCQRTYGHTRSWHQYTNDRDQRTQWSWAEWERREIKQWASKEPEGSNG